MSKPQILWDNYYIALWDNGEIGVSDGAGFIGCIYPEETRQLYIALQEYYWRQL